MQVHVCACVCVHHTWTRARICTSFVHAYEYACAWCKLARYTVNLRPPHMYVCLHYFIKGNYVLPNVHTRQYEGTYVGVHVCTCVQLYVSRSTCECGYFARDIDTCLHTYLQAYIRARTHMNVTMVTSLTFAFCVNGRRIVPYTTIEIIRRSGMPAHAQRLHLARYVHVSACKLELLLIHLHTAQHVFRRRRAA